MPTDAELRALVEKWRARDADLERTLSPSDWGHAADDLESLLRPQEPEQRKCSYCAAVEPGWRDGQCQACGEPSK